MSRIYKGNKLILGGGVGEVALATTSNIAKTLRNEKTNENISANRILEKWETVSADVTPAG